MPFEGYDDTKGNPDQLFSPGGERMQRPHESVHLSDESVRRISLFPGQCRLASHHQGSKGMKNRCCYFNNLQFIFCLLTVCVFVR